MTPGTVAVLAKRSERRVSESEVFREMIRKIEEAREDDGEVALVELRKRREENDDEAESDEAEDSDEKEDVAATRRSSQRARRPRHPARVGSSPRLIKRPVPPSAVQAQAPPPAPARSSDAAGENPW